jgi:hypothetical protein
MKDEDETRLLDPDQSPLIGSDEEAPVGADADKDELLDPTPKYLDPDDNPLDGSLRLPDFVKSVFGNAETFGIDSASFRRSGDEFEILDGGNYRSMNPEEIIEFRNSLERIKSRG